MSVLVGILEKCMPDFTIPLFLLYNGMYSVFIQCVKIYNGNGWEKTVFVITPPECIKMENLCIKIVRSMYLSEKEKCFAENACLDDTELLLLLLLILYLE